MFNSQGGQDVYLEENVFKGYKNGIFVDVGAHDGISINNTLYFEQTNDWKGINVEPLKEVYQKLNFSSCSEAQVDPYFKISKWSYQEFKQEKTQYKY